MTISKRIPVFVGGLALALAAVIFASDAAQAQTATCGALSSGAATCNAQTYSSGIRYDAGNGWNSGIAGPVTITVTGTTGTTTTINAPSAPPNTYTDGAIVIRTAPQGTSDSTLRTVVLTVGSGSNAVAIVEDATETNHGVQVHQFGKAADATTVTVGSGVDIGTSTAPMRQYGVFVLATEGTNTATQKIDSAATIHSTEFGLLMDARGAGDTEVINSGSITTAATGGSAGNKSGIRILDWSHNPSGNSFGGDSRTASTTTTARNSGAVTVSGQYAHGVHVTADGLGLYKTVNSGTVSASGANGHGIYVDARYHTGAAGSKAIEIENSDAIMATGAGGGVGIYVETVDSTAPAGRSIGNVEIKNSGGSITARNVAILVNANMGAISVTHSGAGTVSSSHADGIRVQQGGTGGVTVTSSADVTAENHGIIVSTTPTPAAMLTVAAGLTTKSVEVTVSSGMTATTWPSAVTVTTGTTTTTYVTPGAISVTHSGGDIKAGTESGIWVQQKGAAATVTSSADITAKKYGIFVINDPARATMAIANGMTTNTWSNTGAVSVTHSAGAIAAETESGIHAQNAAGNADEVTVDVTGGSVSTEGQSKAAVAVLQRGTGDAVASVSSGAMLTSKHNAGIYADLGHAANAAGQVKVTQGGTIAARKGVYARAGRASVVTIAAGTTTSETRAAAKQPLIDVTWTGSFSHGTTATVAGNDNDRFLANGVAHAVAVAQEVETEKAMRDGSGHLRYGSPAGIEAQAMSWRALMTQVAKGDDPGAFADAAAVTALFDDSANAATKARAAAIIAAFRAALANDDLATVPGAAAIDTDGTAGLSDDEIETYLSVDDAARRSLLRNVLAQSLSNEEKAVLRAAATNDGLDAALNDEDAGFSDAYKKAVRDLLNRFNVGDISVAVGNTSSISSIVASRGDGIRAYYATPHAMNGAISVTIAAGSTVTGGMAGIYAANAGMGEVTATSDWGQSLNLDETVMLRQQFVTVNGMVTGGTDAAVHLAGGGALLVGDRGRVVAGSSGRAILVNDPGRSGIVIRGEVRGGYGSGDDAVAAIDTTGGGDILLRGDGRVVLADGATNAIRAARTTPGSDETTRVVVSVDGQNVYRNNAGDAVARLGGAVVGNAIPDSDGDGKPDILLAATNEDGTTGMTRAVPLDGGTPDTSGVPRAPSESMEEESPMTMTCDVATDQRCRLYEALPSVLLAMNGLPSRAERMSAPRDAHGAWARVETVSGEWQAADSTRTDVAYDHGRYGARAGVDVAVGEGARLGLSVHSLRGEAEMTRRGGKVELSGVGLGVSATSLFGGGFHVDASAQATRFDVDMTSGLGRRLKESDGSGWALGLEAGRSMTLNSGLSVMPNLGLVWSQASLDTFTDANGSRVSMDDAESLVGRLGVAAVAETDGGPRLFGSVDVTHEFSEETEAMVSGTRLRASAETTGVRLGIGGLFDLGNGASLRGSADYTSAGGGNSAYGAGLGVTMSF